MDIRDTIIDAMNNIANAEELSLDFFRSSRAWIKKTFRYMLALRS